MHLFKYFRLILMLNFLNGCKTKHFQLLQRAQDKFTCAIFHLYLMDLQKQYFYEYACIHTCML